MASVKAESVFPTTTVRKIIPKFQGIEGVGEREGHFDRGPVFIWNFYTASAQLTSKMSINIIIETAPWNGTDVRVAAFKLGKP